MINLTSIWLFNTLAPERSDSNFTSVYLKLILQIEILSTSHEIGLQWVPQNSIH